MDELLGLPLEDALARLSDAGVTPEVTISRAPGREDEMGELRVVRASGDGKALVACAFRVEVEA